MSVYTSSVEFREVAKESGMERVGKGLAMVVVVYIANFVVVVVVVVVVLLLLLLLFCYVFIVSFNLGLFPLQTMVVMVILLTCSHAPTLVWKLVAMATWRRFASSGMIS